MKAKPQHAIIDVLREFFRLSGLAGVALPYVKKGRGDEIVMWWGGCGRSLKLSVTKRKVRFIRTRDVCIAGGQGTMRDGGTVGKPNGKLRSPVAFETLWRWLLAPASGAGSEQGK